VITVAATVGLAQTGGLALGEGEPLADGLGEAVGLGVGVGVTLGDGLADPDGLGEGAETHGVGVLGTRTAVLPAVVVVWCVSSRAAGTTMIPRATVSTKTSAPHSRRQKAHEDFRIRGLRPVPGWAYSDC